MDADTTAPWTSAVAPTTSVNRYRFAFHDEDGQGPVPESDHSPTPDSPQRPDTPAQPEARFDDGNERDMQSRPSFIVGVGASAGGLSPLEKFFAEIDPDTAAAYVVVQHLSPDFKSLMREILSRITKLVVVRAEDGQTCRPGHIYLIPPRTNLRIFNGSLQLSKQPDDAVGPPHPIDVFFESLARDQKERAIAIVLSGTGTDGCRGVRLIAEHGGLVLAQSPETAQFDGMPRAAIGTGMVHKAQPPAGLARTIASYIVGADQTTGMDLEAAIRDGSMLSEVAGILRREGGVDFSHYRRSTIARRIARRLTITGHGQIDTYLRLLDESQEERQALRNDLLIGVTCFFRDRNVWKHLEDEVVPELVRRASEDGVLRAWIGASSTAEEAYSFAMLILEAMERDNLHFDVKMFATDIDTRALETAAAGIYGENITADVSEERLQQFFTRHGSGYRVSRRLREMIIFAEHNLARDAPFTKMDFVSCRNALIYMETGLQEQVLRVLHFSLRQGGHLLLGSAESLSALSSEFQTVNAKCKTFRKSRDVVLPLEQASRLGFMKPLPGTRRSPRAARATNPAAPTSLAPLVQSFQQLTNDLDVACLIVDGAGQLQHALGPANDYLQIPEGVVSSDIYRLAHPSLAIPISTAMHQARKAEDTIRYGSIDFPLTAEEARRVELSVRYYGSSSVEHDTFYLIVLSEEHSNPHASTSAGPATMIEQHARERIEDLERELQATRESLQSTIEELETTNEEQQSTNEELVAANEELQSTNEELQSVNEELFTVNAEFQAKNVELTQLNSDIDNLLRTMQVGTVFLDGALLVRKFTPAARLALHIDDRDIGRSVTDLAHRTDSHDLYEVIRKVAESRKGVERVLQTHDDRRLLMRSFPYRSTEGASSGVVVTFMEIDVFNRTDRHRGAWTSALQNAAGARLFEWGGGVTFEVINAPTNGVLADDPITIPREQFFDSLSVDSRRDVLAILDDLLETPENTLDCTYTRVDADHREREFRLVCYALPDEDVVVGLELPQP